MHHGDSKNKYQVVAKALAFADISFKHHTCDNELECDYILNVDDSYL
jgi:hypothetical protein